MIDLNNVDKSVDDEILSCLNFDAPKSFFLYAGAGSGKTKSLVKALEEIDKKYSLSLRHKKQQIAVITYTNAACEEIKSRVKYNNLFNIQTIHSFIWQLIEKHQYDIKLWIKSELSNEIPQLENELSTIKSTTKKYSDLKKRIERKQKLLNLLPEILHFTYNPNGDNKGRGALSHAQVIKIGSQFLQEKLLMQKILTQKFPILFIDESQDTLKELIDAFFMIEKSHPKFILGLFGDTMQRIYFQGKADLGKKLPALWAKPIKKMNHRCPKRIVKLINKIRLDVDGQRQDPRTDKEEGIVRFFIVPNKTTDKKSLEASICKRMSEITSDSLWAGDNQEIKILTLEHHMAARRMGFYELFDALYKVDDLKTSLLEGKLSGLRFFTQIICPLVDALKKQDEFAIGAIVRNNSMFFDVETLKESKNQLDALKSAKSAVAKLWGLWADDSKIPTLIEILKNVGGSELFAVPNSLISVISPDEPNAGFFDIETGEILSELEDNISTTEAWKQALSCTYDQIEAYNKYISEKSTYGTHQGVKGQEFSRVMVIIDDDEAKGTGFKYDKLFGVKEPSDTDKKNVKEGKETDIDRTKRLFYVACSRAKESLAIVAYTSEPQVLKKNLVEMDWFNEIEILEA